MLSSYRLDSIKYLIESPEEGSCRYKKHIPKKQSLSKSIVVGGVQISIKTIEFNQNIRLEFVRS